jgi:hypothetical protein
MVLRQQWFRTGPVSARFAPRPVEGVSGADMLSDSDEWPVYCPECGGMTAKPISWLLANTRLTCGYCGATIAWYRERMARDLEDAHRAVLSFSKGLWVEKRPQ